MSKADAWGGVWVATFLDELYALGDAGLLDEAGVRIFDRLDRLQTGGDFVAVNAILATADAGRLPGCLRRSLLCITAPSQRRGLLPSYAGFYAAAFAATSGERGAAAAARILGVLAPRDRDTTEESR